MWFPQSHICQTSTWRAQANLFLDCPDLYLRFDCRPTHTCQSLQNKNNIYVCLGSLFINLMRNFETSYAIWTFYFDYCNVRGEPFDFWGGEWCRVVLNLFKPFWTLGILFLLSCAKWYFFPCNTFFFSGVRSNVREFFWAVVVSVMFFLVQVCLQDNFSKLPLPPPSSVKYFSPQASNQNSHLINSLWK